MSEPAAAGDFEAALSSGSLPAVRSFPKADLHCHSWLSAGLASIRRWAGVPIASPPRRMASFDEMREYQHAVLDPHIRSRSGFEFTADRAVVEAIEDGVTIMEMSLDVNAIRLYDSRASRFFDFVDGLARRHAGKLDFRPEIGVSKNRDPGDQVPLAMECVDSGLFRSIDLYGNEHAQPPEAYKALYRHAAARGVKRKAHVGEFGNAALIERTLATLELQEVQHGVAAAESVSLMRLLRGEGVRLNVCPSSNVALSVCATLAQHPLRQLVDNGVAVTINSDDKTIFGNSVSEEYLAVCGARVLTAGELDAIRRSSLTA